jgi:hypothetical protein
MNIVVNSINKGLPEMKMKKFASKLFFDGKEGVYLDVFSGELILLDNRKTEGKVATYNQTTKKREVKDTALVCDTIVTYIGTL